MDAAAQGRQYQEAANQIRTALLQLADADQPDDRAHLLSRAFRALNLQARLHTPLFGRDLIDDEPVRDRAHAHAYTALLWALLADVEKAIAYPGLGGRRHTTTVLERYAGPVLDAMVAEPDLGTRMRMLEQLAEAVQPITGTLALDGLFHLPAPGYAGWLTVEEKEEWLAAWADQPVRPRRWVTAFLTLRARRRST